MIDQEKALWRSIFSIKFAMNNIRTTLGPQHTNILFFIHNYGSISPYYYILLQVQEGFLVDKKSPNCDMYEMSRIFSSGLSFARQSVSPGLRPDEKKQRSDQC
jgi:hypothetical protein